MNFTAAQSTYDLQRDLALAEAQLDSLKFDNPQPGLDHSRVVAQAEREIQPLRDRVAERQAEVGGQVFRIPTENIESLREAFAKVNKRAEKLDVAPVSLIVCDEELEVNFGTETEPEWRTYKFVAVAGSAPKLAGWRFVATLEHDENGVILRKLPTFEGEVDLTAYRDATPENCDHCHTRRRRNDTYVVQHEDGTLKQVGSNCLVDFLGGKSPAQIAQWMQWVADVLSDLEDEESSFYGGSAPERLPLVEFLAHVACSIREFGWTSRGRAYDYGGQATADAAESNFWNMRKRATDRQGCPLWIEPTAADFETAEKAIEWVRSLDEVALESDYLYNLFTVLKGESLGKRQTGIAASAISAHRRAVETEVKEKAREQAKATSDFIGAEKEKVSLQVTCSAIIEIEDRYSHNGGTKPLYKFVDADGNQVSWFSSRWIDDIKQGEALTLTGTVKKHEDHPTYGKSTVLTRCKVA